MLSQQRQGSGFRECHPSEKPMNMLFPARALTRFFSFVGILCSPVTAQEQIHNLYGGVSTSAFGTTVQNVDNSAGIFAPSYILLGDPGRTTASGFESGRVSVYSTGGVHQYDLNGPSSGSRFGAAMAAIADIDGDGEREFAVGAPGVDTNGTDSGAVYVYNGRTGTLIKTLLGSQVGEEFGFSLAGIEDANADGKMDLVVGSPYYNGPGGTNTGRIRVYSSTTWNILEAFNGLAAGDSAGFSVADGSDLNFDGISDVLVGAPFANPGGLTDAGAAYVVSGLDGSILRTWNGPAANANLGWAVFYTDSRYVLGAPGYSGAFADQGYVAAYQTNGNALKWTAYGTSGARLGTSLSFGGVSYSFEFPGTWNITSERVAVGAPGAMAPGPIFGAGALYSYEVDFGNLVGVDYGTTGGVSFGTSVCFIDQATPFGPGPAPEPRLAIGAPADKDSWISGYVKFGATVIQGPKTGIRYGTSVSPLGDVNGDGVPEFAAGAPDADGSMQGSGAVRIVNGSTGSAIRVVPGLQNGSDFGRRLSPAGDTNLDGIPDLLIGAPDYSSASTDFDGAVFLVSGSSGTILRTHVGTSTFSDFGDAIAGGADLTGDGRPDYAIGAPLRNGIGTDTGIFKAYNGATGAEIFTVVGFSTDEMVGSALAMAGDINNDGRVDIAMGSIGALSGAGSVRVYSGSTGALLRTITSSGSDKFGRAIASGDVNQDGVTDLLVGMKRKSAFSLQDQGNVSIYSGIDATQLVSISGEDAYDDLGISVAFLGDVNRDGFGDFAAGAADAVSAFSLGKGKVRIHSGADGLKLHEVSGNLTGDNFGISLAAIGDVNSDSIADWAAGAPQNDLYATSSGLVEVWRSNPDHLSNFGIGTFGCLGPENIWANSTPKVNTPNFRISLTKAPSSSLALGLVGDAWLQFGGDPFQLGVLLHIDLLSSTELISLDLPTDASGRSQVPAPIPNVAALAGRVYYAQTISLWPAAQCVPSAPYGLSSSQGLKITIQ